MGRFAVMMAALAALFAVGSAPIEAWAQAKPYDEQHQQGAAVANTQWAGRVSWDTGEVREWTAHFRDDGVLVYGYDGGIYDNGRWRQREMLITFDTNQYFALHVGHIRGNRMEGVAYNVRGATATWSFRRMR